MTNSIHVVPDTQEDVSFNDSRDFVPDSQVPNNDETIDPTAGTVRTDYCHGHSARPVHCFPPYV